MLSLPAIIPIIIIPVLDYQDPLNSPLCNYLQILQSIQNCIMNRKIFTKKGSKENKMLQ
jgi:hypothetical protein